MTKQKEIEQLKKENERLMELNYEKKTVLETLKKIVKSDRFFSASVFDRDGEMTNDNLIKIVSNLKDEHANLLGVKEGLSLGKDEVFGKLFYLIRVLVKDETVMQETNLTDEEKQMIAQFRLENRNYRGGR